MCFQQSTVVVRDESVGLYIAVLSHAYNKRACMSYGTILAGVNIDGNPIKALAQDGHATIGVKAYDKDAAELKQMQAQQEQL